jgi:CRISPR/Cas system-associated exonuclease Cas4 (RecB family)
MQLGLTMAKSLISKLVEKPKKSEENLIDSQAIVDKIKEGYALQRKSSFKKRDSFTPSTLTYGAGKCPRFWYLWFEGNESDVKTDWYSVANMDSGTDRHGRIEKAMESAGILVTNEERLSYEDPPISGRTDAIINWNDMDILTEIKTLNEDSFHYLNVKGEARKYHVEQLLIYMKILKKSFAFLIYESKNSHELSLFPIKLTDHYKNFINYFFDWMREVKKASDDGLLPENPYRSNSKVCKGCDFETVCRTKPKGDIKIAPRKDLE